MGPSLRASTKADVPALLAGRDAASLRFLGDADDAPQPAFCIVLAGEVVGWVDFDADRSWLEPGELNLGYCVFPGSRGHGYATQAVELLLAHLASDPRWHTATLLIHHENERSLALARRASFDLIGPMDEGIYWKRALRPG